MFTSLNPDKITETADKLSARLGERFADRGLYNVSQEVCQSAREATQLARWLKRPLIWYRVFAGTIIFAIFFLLIAVLVITNPEMQQVGWHEWLQALESGVNDLIFLAVAIFFLLRIERRIKRERALKMLHKLRSLSHVIDMHQLTKDPDAYAKDYSRTSSSPARDLSPANMKRYFDYCSEMLSINGKLAALLVQNFNDPVTLTAVNEIEELTTGLSRKIWQKIMVASSMGNLE